VASRRPSLRVRCHALNLYKDTEHIVLCPPFLVSCEGSLSNILIDYVHTVVILIIIFLFAFTAYATNNIIGSPGRVYDLLVEAAKAHPVEGNTDGSYLTMHSKEGAILKKQKKEK